MQWLLHRLLAQHTYAREVWRLPDFPWLPIPSVAYSRSKTKAKYQSVRDLHIQQDSQAHVLNSPALGLSEISVLAGPYIY